MMEKGLGTVYNLVTEPQAEQGIDGRCTLFQFNS
jgi:hypothetical protein